MGGKYLVTNGASWRPASHTGAAQWGVGNQRWPDLRSRDESKNWMLRQPVRKSKGCLSIQFLVREKTKSQKQSPKKLSSRKQPSKKQLNLPKVNKMSDLSKFSKCLTCLKSVKWLLTFFDFLKSAKWLRSTSKPSICLKR